MEGLYDTVAYSNEALYLVIQETLSVPMFVMIMQKFFLNCELTNTMYCQAPEGGFYIYFSDVYRYMHAIYPEIILLQMLNLSGVYMYFLGTFHFPWWIASYVTWSLKLRGGYCYELVVQIPLFPSSQGSSV